MKQGWTYKKLGEVCEIYNGNSINADYKKQHFYGATGGLPFIATKDVSPLGIIDYNNGVRIPNYNDFKVAPVKSVFICAEGGSAGKKFAYVEQNVCFGNKLFCLNPRNNSLAGKFLYYYIQSDVFKEQFYALLTGLIGGVSAKKFQTIDISFPPLPEQQRIVSRLDTAFAHIDELKANAEKQVNEARALFQKALTKAMEPKEGWEEKKLEELCTDIVDCPHSTPRKMDHPTKYPCIRTSELKGGKIVWESMQYLDEVEYEVRTTRIKPQYNDIVYGREGTYGDAVLLPKGYFFSLGQRTMLFRPDVKYVVPKYLHYNVISSHVYEQAKAKNSGCGVGHVNVKDIKVFKIGVPPLSEQQRIVSRLDSLSTHVRELEEVLQKTIVECDALKQALLRKVFE